MITYMAQFDQSAANEEKRKIVQDRIRSFIDHRQSATATFIFYISLMNIFVGDTTQYLFNHQTPFPIKRIRETRPRDSFTIKSPVNEPFLLGTKAIGKAT